MITDVWKISTRNLKNFFDTGILYSRSDSMISNEIICQFDKSTNQTENQIMKIALKTIYLLLSSRCQF